MHPSVHCSAIYNSQDLEVTEVISRGMDKHTHTHTHTHTHKMEYYSVIKKEKRNVSKACTISVPFVNRTQAFYLP